MKRINIESWKEYKLKDIGFSIFHGSRQKQAEREAGNVPLLTAGKENQGVAAYIGNPLCQYQDPVTVDMFGNCFFHKGIYSGDDNIYFFINKDLNDVIKIFISSIINKQNSILYNFKSQFRQQQADALTVILPSKSDNTPDYEYMESYMKNIMQESEKNIENLICINENKYKVKIDKWKDFLIGELFNIVKPDVLHTKDVDGDIEEIPYVVRTKFDNGIKYKVKRTKQMNPSPAGTISFGAENATFFYQDEEYVSGRDIYYIDTRKISKYACLFLVACLQTITKKYTYNYGMFPELVKKERLKLPITKDAKPDWEYMENYMKNIMDDTKAKLNILKTAI